MPISTYRTFIAFDIEPNSKITDAIDDIKKWLKIYKINWVDSTKFHITLTFLGDTKIPLIDEISFKLKQIALKTNPFIVDVENFGVFPNKKSPKVLWFGLKYTEQLTNLQMDISKTIEDFGFEIDTRPFKPHLTIARVKEMNSLTELESIFKKYSNFKFSTQKIEKIIFYKSTLQPQGAIYEPIEILDFKI